MNFYTNIDISGNTILARGVKDGKPYLSEVRYSPKFYTPSRDGKSPYRSLDGRILEELPFDSINECRDFLDDYSDVSNFELFGNNNFVYQYIHDNHAGEMNYDQKSIDIAFLDIETTCENGFPSATNPIEEINAITVCIDNKFHAFVARDFKNNAPDVEVHRGRDEKEMLSMFLEFWDHAKPVVVTGWNIRFFDIPYLYKRLVHLFGENEAKKLSPWRKIRERIIHRMNRKEMTYRLIGIGCMDYMELYRTFTYVNRESYSLDHICSVELGEKKHSHDEYESMAEFYRKNFQKFVEYNIQDVRLVQKLEDKLKLLELSFAIAYNAKVNHEDIFSQVRTWDTIIYHHLMEKNIVIPNKKKTSDSDEDDQYAGAYVKDPIVGEHDWVVSFDLNSLYPNIICHYNVSPEKMVSTTPLTVDDILEGTDNGRRAMSYAKNQDLSLAASGVMFRRDSRGFLAELMVRMYEERKVFKKKMIEAQKMYEETKDKKYEYEISKYHNFQLVRKVGLNSCYGALGNSHFRFYSRELAESITLSGQLSIRWVMNEINRFLNQQIGTKDCDYVVASDTDSIYLRLDNLVKKVLPKETNKEKIVNFLDKASKKVIQPFITECYSRLSDMMNAFENRMFMEREVIADKGIWTAKKRYMLNVWDSEGVRYENPKMKIMGIETARSSTPLIVREKLKTAIAIILREDNEKLVQFIEDFRQEFRNLPVSEVAFPRSCNGLAKYSGENTIYAKGTPIAVKGSLIYNELLEKKKLKRKYRSIIEGDKIKFLYLKEPNPLREKVISFPSSLPSDLGLDSYVDYDLQFEKSFIDPLNNIVEKIGWRMDREQTLESLFV
jgi:DNA polymerase elongation subunit (family B)